MIRFTMPIAIAAICSAPISTAQAQFGQHDRVPQSQGPAEPPAVTIGEPGPVPPAEPGETQATQPAYQQSSATSEYRTPQSYERQISDLQQAVSQLQGEVAQLRAEADALRLPEDDMYLTTRRPGAGLRCGTRGTMSLATILGRIHDHPGIVSLRDSKSDEDLSTFLVFYANCQRER